MRADVVAFALGLAVVPAAQERPFDRAVIADECARRFDFDRDVEGWHAAHDAEIDPAGTSRTDGVLRIRTTGDDPYVRSGRLDVSGDLLVRIRGRFDVGGEGQVFFTTADQPNEAEVRSARFAFRRGPWAEVECVLGEVDRLTSLRLDPGGGPGTVEIDWLELRRRTLSPLEIEHVRAERDVIRVAVHNHGPGVHAGIDPGRRGEVVRPIREPAPLAIVPISIGNAGTLPIEADETGRTAPLRHVAHVLRAAFDEPDPGGTSLEAGPLRLTLAPDGRGATLDRDGRRVAAVFPLVARDGRALPLHLVDPAGGAPEERRTRAELVADDVRVVLELGADLHVRVTADRPVEGPVLRTIAPQRRAVFAGLEFLRAGERSSSDLDIETDGRWRFAPEPRLCTFPLMACETDGLVVSLRWDANGARPTFLTPNWIDGDDGARIGLRGSAIDARVTVTDGTLEDEIDRATRALPTVPDAPLPRAAWRALALSALRGPLGGEGGGFGHCAEARWPRQPYADFASAWLALTGDVPVEAGPGATLVPGGAHQRDDSIFLRTGRAAEWLALRGDEARRLRAQQREDGSFRYQGEYLRGHFEDTSSGLCLQRAAILLEHAVLTGDLDARVAGLRTLEFAARFQTPRGAQTWELSLHTPDILAAAHGVRAHVLAFDLTGEARWLAAARTWALRGLPFVYLTDDDAAYATIAVYGATNWRAPLWIGLPVQWCGVVYAQALTDLARHDADPRWRTVALGILRRAQRMQYPDGPLGGCLPDIFQLDGRGRAGPSINPCALVYLDATLAGSPAGLSVAVAPDGSRVVAPFPVSIDGRSATIDAPAGARYQVLIDGARIVDVTPDGPDRVELDG